jgi:2-isopropylmalate synthase
LQHRVLEEQGEGASASVVLRGDLPWEGEIRRIEGRGNGPIDAFIQALATSTGHTLRVIDYHQHAIGAGADAQAVAYLELRVDDQRTLFGVGIDANIISASLKAILSGLDRARAQGAASAQSVAETA